MWPGNEGDKMAESINLVLDESDPQNLRLIEIEKVTGESINIGKRTVSQ